uniref:AflS n=1 Tax=Aspergillus ochraceoroseus TaxID=138278 RepID=B5DCI8_9EURO|nr:AflS [Aspergillus ochraceoroseus]
MLTQPSNFLQQLALQTQILANLQWLCEFQVLACIPLEGSVAFEEVADISNVPADRLQRVVRLMTTTGFLCEPSHGHVAHTQLSASFVTEPALLDAALFLAQIAVPAALKMTPEVQPFCTSSDRPPAVGTEGGRRRANDRFCRWSDSSQPKVQRQFAAYLAHGILDEASAVDEVLKLVDWEGLGSTTVVDIHPPSITTAATLAALAPAIQFVVQTSSPSGQGGLIPSPDGPGGPSWMTYHLPSSVSSRISVQSRAPATAQTVVGAALYIMRLPSPSPLLSWTTVRNQVMLELRAHLQVLRAQPTSRLLLTALVLPLPGAVDRGTEAMVRLRDLSLLQLSNDRQPSKPEIIELLATARDSGGGLVLSNEIRSPSSAVIILEVRYQAYEEKGR